MTWASQTKTLTQEKRLEREARGSSISDATPANTVYDDGSRNSAGGTCATGAVDAEAKTTVGTITAPTCNSAGTIKSTIGTLTPSATATVTFGVMINN